MHRGAAGRAAPARSVAARALWRAQQHRTGTRRLQTNATTYLATRKAAPTPGRELRARSATCGKGESVACIPSMIWPSLITFDHDHVLDGEVGGLGHGLKNAVGRVYLAGPDAAVPAFGEGRGHLEHVNGREAALKHVKGRVQSGFTSFYVLETFTPFAKGGFGIIWSGHVYSSYGIFQIVSKTAKDPKSTFETANAIKEGQIMLGMQATLSPSPHVVLMHCRRNLFAMCLGLCGARWWVVGNEGLGMCGVRLWGWGGRVMLRQGPQSPSIPPTPPFLN